MKDGQRRRAFPLRQFPREQRVLRLGIADEVRVLLAVVVFPLVEKFVTVAVAQFMQEFVGTVLNRAVSQRIHPNAHRQPGERIVIFRARQHRSLIAQPPDVAEKSKHQQRANADSNADLCASEPHLRESL